MGWHASSFKDRRPAKWGLTLWPVFSTPACGLAQRTGSFLVTGSDHQRVGDRVRVLKVGGWGWVTWEHRVIPSWAGPRGERNLSCE